jgi:16S rRNA (guanine527-N7)-methyltransferase
MTKEKLFFEFVATQADDFETVHDKFTSYYRELLYFNEQVNLISRKTDPQDLWTVHFYDSLLTLSLPLDFDSKKVLDVGTGGGMPGIPLAIMEPASSVYLLDSRAKKIDVLKKIIKKLDLKRCYPICKRLEDLGVDDIGDDFINGELFDIVVCRSVRVTPKLLKKMLNLLKIGGCILLYKGKIVEQILSESTQVYDFNSLPWGERKIVKIDKL